MSHRSVLLALLAGLAVGVPAASASGATYYVAPSGAGSDCAANAQSAPFATIQAALACTADGDTVSLAPSGSTPYPGIGTVAHGVTIRGTDARSVRIDVSKPTSTTGELVVPAGASVAVQDVTLDCVNHNCLTPNVTNNGRLVLLRDTVTGAGADNAIANVSSGSTQARLTVLSSTIAHNTNQLGTGAAGISSYGGGPSTGALATIVDSTIADNTNYAGITGAGVSTAAVIPGATTLINDTITDNHIGRSRSDSGGAGVFDGFTVPPSSGAPIVATNTIIAGNTGGGGANDCAGALDGSHNIVGDGTGCIGPVDGRNGDQVGVGTHGLLGALGKSGGPTDTIALRPSSLALGAGDPATCRGADVGNVDQRGVTRAAACDVGAFDTAGKGGTARKTWYVGPSGSASSCTATSASNPFGTIQAAVACAQDGDVVKLAPSGSTPYRGIGAVAPSVLIQGSGARSARIDVSQPSDSTGGLVVPVGTSVVAQDVTLDCADHHCFVPNVSNHGSLTLRRDTVTGAAMVTAVENRSSISTRARLAVLGSTIAHNTNVLGDGAAGITSAGGSASAHTDGLVTVVNSTIADNTNSSSDAGAGLFTAGATPGTVTLVNDTITNNHATRSGSAGAGVSSPPNGANAVIVATNTIIAGNTAGGGAGDCTGSVGDGPGGHNVLGDCSGLIDSHNGDQTGVTQPGLDHVILDNGGQTDTIALVTGSPALGHGDAATCQDPRLGDLDQRAKPRRSASRTVCDVGAFDTAGATPAAAHRLIVDGLRLAGPGGAADDYVDVYNPTAGPLDLTGWKLAYPGGSVALGTQTIPAHGHALVAGSDYSLGGYAVPDVAPAGLDLPASGGVQVIAPDGAVTDAVGPTSADAAFREGAGLATPSQSSAQLGFARRIASGLPVDTGANAADFVLEATDADTDNHHAGAVLGAPGPMDLASPIQRNDIVKSALLDATQPTNAAPNREYDAATQTLTIRRTLTNTSATQTITWLRLRITALTTYGAASSKQALLRAVSSDTVGAVHGLALDELPGDVRGSGGLGSSLTPALPDGGLAPHASISVALTFHQDRAGTATFAYNVEAA